VTLSAGNQKRAGKRLCLPLGVRRLKSSGPIKERRVGEVHRDVIRLGLWEKKGTNQGLGVRERVGKDLNRVKKKSLNIVRRGSGFESTGKVGGYRGSFVWIIKEEMEKKGGDMGKKKLLGKKGNRGDAVTRKFWGDLKKKERSVKG